MRLERFGTYTFPRYAVTDNFGRGVSSANLIRTAAGAFDPFGYDQVVSRDYQITRRMELVESTDTALQTALDELRALRGKKDRLMVRTYDDEVRWAWARCIQVDYNRTERNWNFQPVQITFELLTTHWNGDGHTADGWLLDDGLYLDIGLYLDDSNSEAMTSDPYTFTVTNGGNKDVTNSIITITAAGTNITAVNIKNDTNDLTDITWTGTLAVGNSLVINTGTFAITNNGADAYSGLTINSGHAMGHWLKLDTGANDLIIDRTGGSNASTVGINYWDGWA